MRSYLGGDSSSFEVLYHRYSGRVYGYLLKKLCNRESADEVFQAVFLKLHQSRRNHDSTYPFAQWLFVIARTTLLDHFRKAGRQVKTVDQEPGTEPLSQNTPAPTLVQEEKELEVLRHVSVEQRQAIEMRVIDELSYQEIGAKLGHSQESVRQMVSRGLKKIRLLGGGS
jgi:RNA polymerase sigma-70 factor (ECF subfamily)